MKFSALSRVRYGGKSRFGLVEFGTLLSGCLLFVAPVSVGFAQSYFTPLEKGDYEIVDEKTGYNPGIQASGYYRAFSLSRRKDLMGDEYSSHMNQILSLKLQSKLNTNIAVHARIQNRLSLLKNGERGYVSDNPYDEMDSTGDNGMDAEFKEAYLEYNHNPHAILKIGRHEINVGDRKGLIYRGTDTAISQSCRMGTWCTYIGGARLGTHDALYWVQLDYPVFFNDVMIPDPWSEKKERQQSSLRIELFRVRYGGKDTPLAIYGGPTSVGSQYHKKDGDDSPVYYNNEEVEYEGVTVLWNYHDFLLDFSYVLFGGDRVYHTGSQEDGNETKEIGKQDIGGNVFYVDFSYRFHERWRFEGVVLGSSGNETESGKNFWKSDSTAYLEVQKGHFGKSLVYFDGIDRMGEGHSVGNLQFRSLGVAYRSLDKSFGFDISYSDYERTKAVLDHEGNEVRDIGSELDLLSTWWLEERLKFQCYLAVFRPGEAYSPNDNLTPGSSDGDEDNDVFYLGLNLIYDF